MKRLAFGAAALVIACQSMAFGQDVEAGKRIFARCSPCHAVGPNAPNKVGPELNGLFGRKAGSVPGYAYSPANLQSGITWTEEEFTDYIKDPKGVIKGTKMSFAGVKNEQEVKDLVAFLKTFGADGQPK